MNKSYTYSLIVVVLLAVAFIGYSTFSGNQQSSEDQAAVIQAVSGTVGKSQPISWNVSEFPTGKVSINLIRRTSANPARYELVRTIATSVANTGSASWTPASTSEVGNNLFIEVGCVGSAQACEASVSPAPLR